MRRRAERLHGRAGERVSRGSVARRAQQRPLHGRDRAAPARRLEEQPAAERLREEQRMLLDQLTAMARLCDAEHAAERGPGGVWGEDNGMGASAADARESSGRQRLRDYVDLFLLSPDVSEDVDSADQVALDVDSTGGLGGPDGTANQAARAVADVELETQKRRSGRVNLMTIHASKGLEFDCVLISGLEDGALPAPGGIRRLQVT